MSALGYACLIAALPLALFAVGAALWSHRSRDRRWMSSAQRAVYLLAALMTTCVVAVETAFLTDDFSLALAANHSSESTPAFYKFTAMWSSQEGSLLLWAWVLSLVSSLAIFLNRNRHRELLPIATAVLGGIATFFIGLMLFKANPFAALSPAPVDGAGLNPLLRHPSMAIHPPMLYSGYVWFSVPFAFAIAALVTRRLDSSWIVLTRRFTLVAWTFLTFGVLLGARWSYTELGWGGYWAWDPVENASLMPWLLGTAFLHSVMVQEKRGMLKVWNVSLIAGTFTLALLGTFLVRSGILESIHAFGASTVGGPMLGLIAVVLVGSAALIVSRLGDLRSERRIDSLLSRESIFLVNNLLLVGLCGVIFWGTFFPLIAEAVTGETSSLAAPWFDRYTVPLAIGLVLFTGIGPLLAWRQISAGGVRRVLAFPTAVATAVAAVGALFTDARDEPLALVLFACAGFAIAALAQEFWRGTSGQRALTGQATGAAFGSLIARNRRRYGGYIVHLGVVVLFVGIAASSSFQTNRDVRLKPGESASVGGYDIRYERPTASVTGERISFGAVVPVSRDGEPVTTLRPRRNYYPTRDISQGAFGRFFEGEATSEVGLRAGLSKDLWTAMQPDIEPILARAKRIDAAFEKLGPKAQETALQATGPVVSRLVNGFVADEDPPPVTFRFIVNPMVSWMWIGALIGLGGALLALWPAPSARTSSVSGLAAARRLGQELGRG